MLARRYRIHLRDPTGHPKRTSDRIRSWIRFRIATDERTYGRTENPPIPPRESCTLLTRTRKAVDNSNLEPDMSKLDGRHNHPPRCCCDDGPELGGSGPCPACPEHGELAPGIECPQCHQPIGRPHTEFCTLAPDRVWPDGIKAPGQWLLYEGEHPRTDHRAAGGTWHPVAICTRVYCGATPDDAEWPAPRRSE